MLKCFLSFFINFAMIIVFCFSSSYAKANQQGAVRAQSGGMSSQLLPQVEQLITNLPEPTMTFLLQDAFVGLYGIDAPLGVDYMALGAQAVFNNTIYFRQAMAGDWKSRGLYDEVKNYYKGLPVLKLNRQIDGKDFIFPCKRLDTDGCVMQTLALKSEVAALIDQNKILMERYVAIQQLPNYGNYHYRISDHFFQYHYVLFLAELRLAQSIIAWDAGDVDKAFTILSEEVAFARRMFLQDTRGGPTCQNNQPISISVK